MQEASRTILSLSPIYDLAPMKFDPDGLTRNTRWGTIKIDGDPKEIAALLAEKKLASIAKLRIAAKAFYEKVKGLETLMTQLKVPASIISGKKRKRRSA